MMPRRTGMPRAGDESGSAMVAGIVVLFAFTFLGIVWLTRDVDRGVSNRSAAQSIAFQAARSGAQATSIDVLRADARIVIDPAAAELAVEQSATTLLSSYGLEGSVTAIRVADDRVSVTVTVTDGGITVTGSGTVRAERAP